MKIHELKTVQPHFDRVVSGIKTFELRKNDRDYDTGDLLLLKEWNVNNEAFTGDYQLVKVTHIIKGFQGLVDGFCIMSIKLIN